MERKEHAYTRGDANLGGQMNKPQLSKSLTTNANMRRPILSREVCQQSARVLSIRSSLAMGC